MKQDDTISIWFFVIWGSLMAVLFYFTWPPTTFVIMFWFACGLFIASIFGYEDIKSNNPLTIGVYIKWAIWVICGTVSVLVFISAGWYIYRIEKEPWKRQTLR